MTCSGAGVTEQNSDMNRYAGMWEASRQGASTSPISSPKTKEWA